MKKVLAKVINKMGYSVVKTKNLDGAHLDINENEFWDIYHLCKPYTMTSIERMYALYSAVDYILTNDIEGDFVECGVWRGGSAMLIASMLDKRNVKDRKIFLFDTFEGMSAPISKDVNLKGDAASQLLETSVHNKETSVWCLADLDDVKNNLSKTNLSDDNLIYVKGKVEDTLPCNQLTGKIALLRLDTDWYESTKHELITLFPMLVKNGVLIIDDYGHWQGCREAVDEYFAANKLSIFLSRIDYTGRIAIKNF